MVRWIDNDRVFPRTSEGGNSGTVFYTSYFGKSAEMPSGTDECLLLHGITLSDPADSEQKAAVGDFAFTALLCGGLCVSAVLGDKEPVLLSLLCLPPDPGGHCNRFAGAVPGEKIQGDERQEKVGREGLCAAGRIDKAD